MVKRKTKVEVLETGLTLNVMSPKAWIDMLEGYLNNDDYSNLRFEYDCADEYWLVADRLETDKERDKRLAANKKRKITAKKNKKAKLESLKKEIAKLEKEVG